MIPFNQARIPQDDLKPRESTWQPLPSGKYLAEFALAEVVGNDAGWEALKVTAVVKETADGATEVKKGEDTIRLGQREVRTTITTNYDTDDADKAAKIAEISQRQLTALFYSLGLASVNGDGTVDMGSHNFTTTDDIVETLSGSYGDTFGVQVTSRQRKKGGKRQTRDDGSPIIDEEISGFVKASELREAAGV